MQGSITPSNPTRPKWTARALIPLALAALALPGQAAARSCDDQGREPSELSVGAARDSVLCLINQRRNGHGLRNLRPDSRLARAAQGHSASMDRSNYFSHNSPSGSSPASRIRNAGYLAGASSWAIAENISWGSGGLGSPKATVRAWMGSPPHRAALLSNRYRHLGVGVALGSPTGGGEGNAAIYTADFGFRG